MAQNVGSIDFMPQSVTVSATTYSQGDGACVTANQPAAATKAEQATCHRRSPVRSECRPTSSIAAIANTHGMSANRPIRKSLALGNCERRNSGWKKPKALSPIATVK